jgi:hypothetical protein
MPPDHQGDAVTRSVLRRFSHFQKLQRMVRCSYTSSSRLSMSGLAIRLHRHHRPILRAACPWPATAAIRFMSSANTMVQSHPSHH